MYAIIKTGGKQYKVTEGQEIFIEKLTAEENETVEIPVVAVGNEDGTLILLKARQFQQRF